MNKQKLIAYLLREIDLLKELKSDFARGELSTLKYILTNIENGMFDN